MPAQLSMFLIGYNPTNSQNFEALIAMGWVQGYVLEQHNEKFDGFLGQAVGKSDVHNYMYPYILDSIGGFRGGAEGAVAPPFFWYFQNVFRFCFENRFIKGSFIDSIFRNVNVTLLCITNTPTMLYAACSEK